MNDTGQLWTDLRRPSRITAAMNAQPVAPSSWRAKARHPRLTCMAAAKSWMPTGAWHRALVPVVGMTGETDLRAIVDSFNVAHRLTRKPLHQSRARNGDMRSATIHPGGSHPGLHRGPAARAVAERQDGPDRACPGTLPGRCRGRAVAAGAPARRETRPRYAMGAPHPERPFLQLASRDAHDKNRNPARPYCDRPRVV
jgi:hypothetical protein